MMPHFLRQFFWEIPECIAQAQIHPIWQKSWEKDYKHLYFIEYWKIHTKQVCLMSNSTGLNCESSLHFTWRELFLWLSYKERSISVTSISARMLPEKKVHVKVWNRAIDKPLQTLLSQSLWGTQSHRDQGGSFWAAETLSPYERAESASYSSTTEKDTTQLIKYSFVHSHTLNLTGVLKAEYWAQSTRVLFKPLCK